jgi:hypothetical protein
MLATIAIDGKSDLTSDFLRHLNPIILNNWPTIAYIC